MSVELFSSLLVFIVCLFFLVGAVAGNRSISFMKNFEPLTGNHPRVSIVVAARNEADGIEKAVRSFLVLDYPNYELMVVNDRSEDETGEILQNLQREFPILKVLTINMLPTGWLGKNHALWKGALETSGDYILFTDGDVILQPQALSHAIGMMTARNLDHLAGFPKMPLKGIWLQSFISYFIVAFGSYTRPWKASDPKSPGAVGIGAFNLVRRSSYLSIGTHERFRLRPDDDLKLGQLLKKSGAKQECAFASNLIEVEWYRSMRELVHGLEKNSFSAFDYRLERALIATLGILVFTVAPFFAPFFLCGWPALLMVLSALSLVAASIYSGRFHEMGVKPSLLFPFSALLFTLIFWNGILKTLWKGGIQWRGTFYRLDDLRRGLG